MKNIIVNFPQHYRNAIVTLALVLAAWQLGRTSGPHDLGADHSADRDGEALYLIVGPA